jgi:hypothetical protein
VRIERKNRDSTRLAKRKKEKKHTFERRPETIKYVANDESSVAME